MGIHICPLLVPSILNICILRSVLPTLAFQEEYLCSQPKPSLATKSGKTGADCCCSGARRCPFCCSTGRLGSNPSGKQLRGSSGARLPPHTQPLVLHWFWNVSAVQRCTFPHGAKSASSARQFPCAPLQTVSFGLDHNPLLPRALEPLC